MPTEKRQRKKEGHQARKAAALAAARREQRKRRLLTAVAVAVAVLAVMALVSFLGGDDDETDVASEGTTTTEAPSTTSTTLDITKPEVSVPAEPATELIVNDIVEGDGPEAKLGDTIEVHYVGKKQADGSEFDASWDGAPISFELAEGRLIKGWTDGIPGMKVGGRRELIIPESLAYQGQEPSGTLVFVVDLISIK